jgi:hypothetical protein
MDTSLDEFFAEHLPYEIWMMRDSLQAVARIGLSEFEKNAFIETFCLHARNLVEFFKRQGDSGPHPFTDAEFKRNHKGVVSVKKIQEQVSHLRRGRTKDETQKINGHDLTKMHEAIEAEIQRFARHLKSEWLGKWKITPSQTPPQIKAMLTMTTTSSVTHYQAVTGLLKNQVVVA